MSVKEPDNFERTLRQRFEGHRIEEGRDLFPGISETLNQAQNKYTVIRRYMLAASVTVAFVSGIFLLNRQFSKSPDYITSSHQSHTTVSTPEAKEFITPDQKTETTNLYEAEDINVETIPALRSTQIIVEKAVQRGKLVKLPDGSTIVLEAGSAVKYASDYGEKSRTIYLEGIAFFDVARQDKLPFVVSTSRSVTTVLGTTFNIHSLSDSGEDQITVYAGMVRFGCKNEDQYLQLAAGSSAVLKEGEGLHVVNYHPNANAWQSGKLVFEGTSVGEVIEDLETYFGHTIAVSDSTILNCVFSGAFVNPKLDEVISVISLSLNLNYEERADCIRLIGKGCAGL